MPDFAIKRLPYNLTAHAGLSLVGQYLKRFAQIDQIIDPRFPISGKGGIATSSLIKAYVGLLCTGKSDFDAIESLRQDAFFKSALGLAAVPSSPTLRQRMDALADPGIARSPPWTTPTSACCAGPSPTSRRCPPAIWPWTSMSLPWTTVARPRKGWAAPIWASMATRRSPAIWPRKATAWAWNCVRARNIRPAKHRISSPACCHAPGRCRVCRSWCGRIGFR
jgi:hypothetical protein